MPGTAIVTGASGGIGRAVARRLARDGFAVVVGYAGRASTAEEAVAEIVELGGQAAPVQADVASAADVERLFRTTLDTFGSVDDLKAQVNDAGVKRFGSGWTWLVWDGTGLAVLSTPNQDSPLMDGKTPILGVDVWEHAYYLKYQNRRPDYLAAWWNVVDWNAVAAKFDAAHSS